jgi:hypothetical protein
VICVATPPSRATRADPRTVDTATEIAGRLLVRGTLVALESTYLSTTDEVVLPPLLEQVSRLIAGDDFALTFSPERIDRGNPSYGTRNTPKFPRGPDIVLRRRGHWFLQQDVRAGRPTWTGSPRCPPGTRHARTHYEPRSWRHEPGMRMRANVHKAIGEQGVIRND